MESTKNFDTDCIFCNILAGNLDGTFVYRDDTVSAFMDIRPVNHGHVLVVPNDHAANLAELPPDTGAHIFKMAQKIAAAIRAGEVPCEGINFFLADGAVAMQTVFHVHLHVLPRTTGDGFGLQFGEHYFNPPNRDSLAQAGDHIRQALESL